MRFAEVLKSMGEGGAPNAFGCRTAVFCSRCGFEMVVESVDKSTGFCWRKFISPSELMSSFRSSLASAASSASAVITQITKERKNMFTMDNHISSDWCFEV